MTKATLRAGDVGSVIAQSLGFLRKETAQIIRQPRLLITLVLGPFVLLVIFGNSYRQDAANLRTVFVGPPGSSYEAAIDKYRDELNKYVTVVGYMSDRHRAESELARGNIDLVVVLPADAAQSIAAGKQAPIIVLNDKVDPVQSAAVDIAARFAVQEVNASIVSSVLTQAQTATEPLQGTVATLLSAADTLSRAATSDDAAAVANAASNLQTEVDRLRQGTQFAIYALQGADGEEAARRKAQLDEVETKLRDIDTLTTRMREPGSQAETQQAAGRVRQDIEAAKIIVSDFASVEPSLLVRPFVAETRTLLPRPIGVTEFFAPSSIALLLQHLALTLSALTIIRDRSVGLLEMYRVGPTSVTSIMIGRFLAFSAAGLVAAAILLTAVTQFLAVPILGSILWVGVAITAVLLASVALGVIIGLISRTDSEVVQYAMLLLLASLFFGGFVLDLGLFNYPGKVISWLLPVTYGIKILQSSMLRGTTPDVPDVASLGAQLIVYGVIGVAMFRRRLRTA